jgi:hypothetical protein
MSRRPPDFDDLMGNDVTPAERDRLRRVHDLVVAAGPPPELTTELESVQWPEEALAPLGLTRRAGAGKRKHSRLLLVAAALTIAAAAFLLGQATSTNSSSMDVRKVVKLQGTALDRDALATLELGNPDLQGNWPMILHASGLQSLPEAGYYDLYLTRKGKPVALCATFNVNRRGEVNIRFSAAYQLEHFDRNGWVVTRQIPPNHEPTQIVLRQAGGTGSI